MISSCIHATNKKPVTAAELLYYTIPLLSAGLLLAWVGKAPDAALRILLLPQKWAAEIFYHTTFYYYEGIGYKAVHSAYAIGRECMGYNFTLLLYAMNACTFGRYFSGCRRALWLITSFLSAVLIGLVVSSLRIIGSIPFSGHPDFQLIHLAIGVIMYLFVLMADYMGLNKLFGETCHEEQ